MSALANITAPQQTQNTQATAVTDISVTARIDYNLRFTKQAVLVVGDNSSQYSQLASQYLVNLSTPTSNNAKQQFNVAFVAASSKINDIQMRCRLVEQLFSNTLFDPEQSLAVSVLNFAKQQGEAISIVIDHAHALSLQVKYELCQLVSQAKKSKLTINVVLFGLSESVQQLSANRSLFKNKIAIIQADNGQVLSMDDKKFTQHNTISTFSLGHKIAFAVSILLILVACSWLYVLITNDVSQFSNKVPHQMVLDDNANPGELFKDSNTQLLSGDPTSRKLQKKEKQTLQPLVNNASTVAPTKQATSEEITSALFNTPTESNLPAEKAKASDILQALNGISAASIKAAKPESLANLNSNYYLDNVADYKQGYVVQIAGFSDDILLKKFLAQHSRQNLHSYKRLLDGKSFSVVTSQIYPTKNEAKAAMAVLPLELLDRKPWLKAISSVTDEINTFNR